jgi:hypothetical protein
MGRLCRKRCMVLCDLLSVLPWELQNESRCKIVDMTAKKIRHPPDVNQVERVLAIWTKRAPSYATNYERISALCSDWNEYDVEKAVVIMLDRCDVTPCGVDARLLMVENILETL